MLTPEVKCSDCLLEMQKFPDKFFDLAIVDPPYGIGLGFSAGHQQKDKKKKIGIGHEQKDWNKNVPSKGYFQELLRISKKYIIWGCNYYTDSIDLFHVGRIIHYKKPTPFIQSTYSHADIAATNCQNRITLYEFQWSGNVQNGKMNVDSIEDPNSGLENRIHPTQKPVALYKWLLHNYAKAGDKILDTHLGSGSSRIAAHDMGFQFWGYEIDKDYFEAQEKRFKQHIAQLTLSL